MSSVFGNGNNQCTAQREIQSQFTLSATVPSSRDVPLVADLNSSNVGNSANNLQIYVLGFFTDRPRRRV